MGHLCCSGWRKLLALQMIPGPSSQCKAGMVVAPPELYTDQTNFSMGRTSSGSSPSTRSWLVSIPSPRSWKAEMMGSSLGKDTYEVIQLFFEMPTNFLPQSAPVKLWKQIRPWHFSQPMTLTRSWMVIDQHLSPFPVRKLSLVSHKVHQQDQCVSVRRPHIYASQRGVTGGINYMQRNHGVCLLMIASGHRLSQGVGLIDLNWYLSRPPFVSSILSIPPVQYYQECCRSFLRPEQHWCPISYAPTLWLGGAKAIQQLTYAYCPLEKNGWMFARDEYVPVPCLYKPAPVAVLELIKCGCKTSCKGHCSCKKNNLPCSLQMPHFGLQQPSWLQDDSRWRWCMTVAGGEQGWHYQKIVYHCFNSLSVLHGMFHDRCVVYVCLKNLT